LGERGGFCQTVLHIAALLPVQRITNAFQARPHLPNQLHSRVIILLPRNPPQILLHAHSIERTLQLLPADLEGVYRPLLEHQNDEDYRFVKYADKLCAYIKCIEELKTGNTEFEQAKCKIAEQLFHIEEPAVLYFMKHFLPSYGLTIDELNK